jgi:thiol-disulfide isomerase/thioredoxin
MKNRTHSRARLAAFVLVAGVAVAVAAVMLVGGPGSRLGYTVPGNTGSATGTSIAVTASTARPPAESIEFVDRDGRPLGLEDFRGRVVLVNLWATWCPPCVAEMPALDALEARLGGPDFQVVAVALDRGGTQLVERWFARAGLHHLAVFSGDVTRFGNALLPTSILLDRQGRVAWRGLGGRPWDQPQAAAAIESLMAEQ